MDARARASRASKAASCNGAGGPARPVRDEEDREVEEVLDMTAMIYRGVVRYVLLGKLLYMCVQRSLSREWIMTLNF